MLFPLIKTNFHFLLMVSKTNVCKYSTNEPWSFMVETLIGYYSFSSLLVFGRVFVFGRTRVIFRPFLLH